MIEFVLNGTLIRVNVEADRPLLWVLRDSLQHKGTKYGCGVGVCGICTVLIDGEPNHACMVPVHKVAGKSVLTVEGLARAQPALVAAWLAEQVPQCGYCQGGQLLAAAALLTQHPQPTDAEIDAAMHGVLCRCGTYPRIRRAIARAARGDTLIAPIPTPLPPAPDAGIALDAFIRIHADNTLTLQINHSEMGQGALTNLCVLVAEELEFPLAHIRTEFAPADPVYKNPLWGQQFTGGSSSMRGEWQPLRERAAQARERLRAAAAKHWQVAEADCRVRDGHVEHPPSQQRLAVSALAMDAARRKPPHHVTLKAHGNFRLIGQATPRLDLPDMVTGRTIYGIDVTLPYLRVATIARCPVFGGRVKHFDASAALALPGVTDVLEISSGVAVVAQDAWTALRAREQLHVTWTPGRQASLSHEAIYRELIDACNTKGKKQRDTGNVKRALKQAHRSHAARYLTPFLAHGTLEPMNCVADVRADGCDVYVGTQSQVDTHAVAAKLSGLPRHQVRVHTQFLGGGFGRRLDTDFVAEAVELSKKLKAPVQVLWSRADDLQHGKYRPAGAMQLDAALDAAGLPTAWIMRVVGSDLVLGGTSLPYAIANVREEHVEVPSAVPTGAWRSVGASNNAFAIECFMDELAHTAGRDPLAFRLALLGEGSRHRTVLELAAAKSAWSSPRSTGRGVADRTDDCTDAGGRAMPGAIAEARAARQGSRGRGLAVYESFGSVAAMVAEVAVSGTTIRVPRVVCALDCGIAVNPDSVRAQVEGAIALGLSAALKEELTIENGRVTQSSFADYPILTLAEMPQVEVHIVPNANDPGGVGFGSRRCSTASIPGGVGEPAVPVIAPAVANAVFAATGRRLRALPLKL